MNDFNDALRQGLASAIQAGENIAEIEGVIAELREAVEEISHDTVTLQDFDAAEGTTLRGVAGALMAVTMPEAFKMVRQLVFAARESDQKTFNLAQLDISSYGYPCTVINGSQRHSCHDRESLVAALTNILKSPSAGKALKSLGAFNQV